MLSEQEIIRSLCLPLLRWFESNARPLPWRDTLDPYTIWVSEVMLQQTQVKTVTPYFIRWMGRLPTVQDLAMSEESEVLKLWEGLGYYSRARNLRRGAHQMIQDYGGVMPRRKCELVSIYGIGEYTAGAILSIAFGYPEPAIDGNVVRVSSRMLGIRELINKKVVQDRLKSWVKRVLEVGYSSRDTLHNFCNAGGRHVTGTLNEALIELGATLCTPVNPQCGLCPIQLNCEARKERLVDSIPKLTTRPLITRKQKLVLVIRRSEGDYLVFQNSSLDWNQGLWGFLQVDRHLTGVRDTLNAMVQSIGVRDLNRLKPKRLGKLEHSITRYRIELTIYCIQLDGFESVMVNGEAGWRWVEREEFGSLAMSAAHRKIAERMLP